MKNIAELGEKIQEIKFKGNTTSFFRLVSRLSGSIQEKTVRNYMRILAREKYISFDNGVWTARVEEQLQFDKKDEPIKSEKEASKIFEGFKNATVINEKPGTEQKRPEIDDKARKRMQRKRQVEVQRLVSNSYEQRYSDDITNLLNKLDKKQVTILWETQTIYHIVCKDCYELYTGKRWINNQENKRLRAHTGILQQAIDTTYCQMCGTELCGK